MNTNETSTVRDANFLKREAEKDGRKKILDGRAHELSEEHQRGLESGVDPESPTSKIHMRRFRPKREKNMWYKFLSRDSALALIVTKPLDFTIQATRTALDFLGKHVNLPSNLTGSTQSLSAQFQPMVEMVDPAVASQIHRYIDDVVNSSSPTISRHVLNQNPELLVWRDNVSSLQRQFQDGLIAADDAVNQMSNTLIENQHVRRFQMGGQTVYAIVSDAASSVSPAFRTSADASSSTRLISREANDNSNVPVHVFRRVAEATTSAAPTSIANPTPISTLTATANAFDNAVHSITRSIRDIALSSAAYARPLELAPVLAPVAPSFRNT